MAADRQAAALDGRQAALDALAGMTAYESRMFGEVAKIGTSTPAQAFFGAVAVALRLAGEVDRLGGDSRALRDSMYDAVQALAPS
jgi:hypothetical protein